MNAARIARNILLPFAVLAAVALTHGAFSRAFDATAAYVRLKAGQLATRIGVVPETEGILLGIYKPEVPYSLSRLAQWEASVGKSVDVISIYQTWGDRDIDAFPRELMQQSDDHGAMTMITWEPWLSEFEQNRGDPLAGVRTDLRSIANGAYDAYVRTWAREAAIFGKVLFLRFGHEMNNPQYPWSEQAGNTSADFVAAWRHLWNIFREEGARNVLWVWSPRGQLPAEFYPGGAYVDWIGTGVFNYGSYAPGGAWQTFESLYTPIYQSALVYDKPIMIAELGSTSLGGDQVSWYADALEMLATRFRGTRAIVLFNNPADETLQGTIIDWSIDQSTDVSAAFRARVAAGTFHSK